MDQLRFSGLFTQMEDLSGKKVHFIGIGGAGMSGIARIMLSQGIRVSGSDLKASSVTENLKTMGAEIYIGHREENLVDVDLIVLSTAISADNPEQIRGLREGISFIPRAQALAILMSNKRSVAVAGTHGKTTTTSMLTVALQSAGLDPSFAIGGMINASGTNAYSGSGDIFIAEADESDGSFLAYKPFGAIITNIELDHVDHFKDLESIYALFEEFVRSIQAGGFLVACHADQGVRELLSRITRSDIEIITYGDEDSDWALTRKALSPRGSHSRIAHRGSIVGDLELIVPGEHNILNAIAALAASSALSVSPELVLKGLFTFSGTKRRFEFKGEENGIEVIDDYGHHPTEISVTLEAARNYIGGGKVFVIFQPHRYSRTKAFACEFAKALEIADFVYLLEVYAASETPIPGVSSLLISSKMDEAKVHYEPSMIKVVEDVCSKASAGDMIITLGAGDVSSLAPVILTTLKEI